MSIEWLYSDMNIYNRLGHADTLRFLVLQHADAADYMELRERLFDGLSVKELYQQAADWWQHRQDT